MRLPLLLGAALAPLAFAGATAAQTMPDPEPAQVEDVVVTGDIVFRNRTTDDSPILSYDLEYFQRFEPISVGEMLKRVPGVTFTSDVLEFDGVSFRGLPPGYTNILINGRRAPGGEDDGSFFVDRIPAELVERVEIIRSPRADQPSDGIAGAVNVVLKEGATLEGGQARAAALINADGEVRGSGSIAYAGNTEDSSFWAALNYQGRRNPKEKTSLRYTDDPANGGELDNIEEQADTRDGEDISANGEYVRRFNNGRLRFNGLVVDTSRDEDETSLTYVDDGAGAFVELDETEIQQERISQQTYAASVDGQFDMGPGQIDFDFGWSGFRDDTTATVYASDDEPDVTLLDEFVATDITDDEYAGGAAYTWGRGAGFKLKAGVDVLVKNRDGAEVEYDIDDEAIGDPDPAPGAIYTIEETRIDPFVRLTRDFGSGFNLDLGLRYENTSRDVSSDLGTVENDQSELFPSVHATWQVTSADQFRASYARTQRRPEYSFLVPYLAEEEPTDGDDLRGNPMLDSELANGFDVGYEHRLGQRGILGVNVFYRDIQDVIDLVSTGETSSSGDGDVYEPRNIGDGTTWGVELDFSAPLDFIGLPDTGLFFNYTYLDSEVQDPFTGEDRPFTNQPSNVYNIGFIQTLNAWDASFGASLYDRDAGHESGFDETVTVDYDPDLEAFIEKRFGDRFVIRLSAQNLLDKHKDEVFFKYDGDSTAEVLANRRNGVVDEYEVESEHSGALYQVTLRATF